jgi:hypothetical protein
MVFLDMKWTWYEMTNSLEPTDWFPFYLYIIKKVKIHTLGEGQKNIAGAKTYFESLTTTCNPICFVNRPLFIDVICIYVRTLVSSTISISHVALVVYQ